MDFMVVRLLLMPAAEFLIFKVQITSGAVPLKLCFSASDTRLFQHLSCVQMTLHSKALTFQFKIIVISFRKWSQGLLQNFCIFGEAATPGIGAVGIHPVP